MIEERSLHERASIIKLDKLLHVDVVIPGETIAKNGNSSDRPYCWCLMSQNDLKKLQ